MLSGILCMNKPEGFTSFDVIGKLRGILKMKRLGHAGTLDPMATGVLPVFVGNATKASSIMTCNEKSYLAGFRLGVTTDTQDITGKILEEKAFDISRDEFLNTAASFKGVIKQIPPMYSAVSVGGKRLYELARAGIEVEREAREIEITALEIREYDEQSGCGTVYIGCSKGTYIRTIIHDIGQKLGCGATMTSLVRTSSNGFLLEQCHTFEEVEKYRDEDRLCELILPVDRVFLDYPKLVLTPKKAEMYKNGVKLMLDRLGEIPQAEKYRIYDDNGHFFGLAKSDMENNVLRVDKNLF